MKQSVLHAFFAAGTIAAASSLSTPPAEAFTLKINPATAHSSRDNTPLGPAGVSAELDFSFEKVGNSVFMTVVTKNTTDSAVALSSRLVNIAFDLPSLVTGKFVVDRDPIGMSDPKRANSFNGVNLGPFTNNPPTGYPGGQFDVGVRFGPQSGGFGQTNTGGLGNGQVSSITYELTGAGITTAKQVEGAFYWGFFNVDGNGPIQADPLRAAVRFLDIELPDPTPRNPNRVRFVNESLLAKAEAVPTPALLPALLAFGAGVLRKKQEEKQSQEV